MISIEEIDVTVQADGWVEFDHPAFPSPVFERLGRAGDDIMAAKRPSQAGQYFNEAPEGRSICLPQPSQILSSSAETDASSLAWWLDVSLAPLWKSSFWKWCLFAMLVGASLAFFIGESASDQRRIVQHVIGCSSSTNTCRDLGGH
jgi:hypothetical protein